MKVALFTETYVPYINGVVTHVKVLREGLEALGHEVLVVCADPDIYRYRLEDGVLYCPGVSFKKFYDYGLASPVSAARLKYIKDFDPDIIHIHTEFGVGFSGAAMAKILSVPLVYTLHTMYDDYLYYIAPKKLIKIAKKTTHAYAKSLGEWANALTGPSKKVEEYFRNIGVDKPVHIIPNPVEIELFTPDCATEEQKKEIRSRYGVTDDDMLVCFCGRLGKEKSVDVMLDFWAQTVKPQDNIKLLIIGEGPSKEELEQQAVELGIGDQVHFAGKILHDKLPPYYAACDLYITTSLSDTNSISMLEGMAAGLPVLHIRDVLNKGQVVDGVNGYIFQDAQEMYTLLTRYKNMPQQERMELRREARESVKQSGAETLANNLLQVYKVAIETKNAEKVTREV